MKIARTLAVAVALVALWGGDAPASGGLFCDAQAPVAVEQSRSRVLLEIGQDEVTATIDLSWAGRPEEFAWLVPIPGDPVLEVVPASALRLLDAATAPRIVPPPLVGTEYDGDDDSAWDGAAPLGVEDLPQVGPYDPVLLTSNDAGAVAAWLQDNGFLLTSEMEPLLASYIASGMEFLALKLAPGSESRDVRPISITWSGNQVMLPLVASSVAAEPEMGIAVFLAGETMMQPVGLPSLQVDSALVRADPRTGIDNYQPLLSWLADQEGGQAFFNEYSDAAAEVEARLDAIAVATTDAIEARAWVDAVIGEHGWMTRLYTRMSPGEMTLDPVFVAAGSARVVPGLHDLSLRSPVPDDLSLAPPSPCAATFCGPGGRCATTDVEGTDGCVCDAGWVARAIGAPGLHAAGGATVTCQDASRDLMASVADLFAENDPCAGIDCGAGACKLLGGMPVCDCDDGMAGIAGQDGPTCVAALQVYEPDQLLWPGWPPEPSQGGDDDEEPARATSAGGGLCDASGAGAGRPIALLLPATTLLAGRRRRSRR